MKNFGIKALLFAFALIGVVGCSEEPKEINDNITLSVDKSEITADGEDVATFTVKAGEEDITNSVIIFNKADNSAVAGRTFSTSEAATYTFYAQKGQVKSNEVTVVAKAVENGEQPEEPEQPENPEQPEQPEDPEQPEQPEDPEQPEQPEETKPIVLVASKTSIVADGVDMVEFTVTQGDVDVTRECAITVNGSVINGYSLKATEAGTFICFATKDGLTSKIVTITATSAPVAGEGKSMVFAEGVSIASGWYDVNKKGAGDNGDIMMCWAAASSNMIQWWQDRYVAAGNTLPSTAVTGPGTKSHGSFGPYELAIMDIYHSQWNTAKGGDAYQAIPWYFEGVNNAASFNDSHAQPLSGYNGGFLSSIMNDAKSNMYCEYTIEGMSFLLGEKNQYVGEYTNYYNWGQGSELQGDAKLKKFTEFIVKFIDNGIASLTVAVDTANLSGAHHAVTLWGYEIDNATGLLTRIWITDSDDLIAEPKEPRLNEYTVGLSSAGTIEFKKTTTRYNLYAVAIQPLAGYGSK